MLQTIEDTTILIENRLSTEVLPGHLSSSSVELDSSPIKSSVEQTARKKMDHLELYLGCENKIDEGHRKRKIVVSLWSCFSDFRMDMLFPLSDVHQV